MTQREITDFKNFMMEHVSKGDKGVREFYKIKI